ncbi:MAG TPA: DUF748 domain-containing protein [Verrucomicrobiae bacterium]|nr:DUF748 domain-containing protein [Verrucomicrobiae bacterium]
MRRRRLALALAIAAAVLLVSVVLGPGLVARRVATQVSRSLGAPVHVGWLRWNPFTGCWTLDRLRIAADRGPAALAARRVSARIHLWDTLRGSCRVRTLVLDGARLRLRATPAGWQLPLPAGPPEAAGAPAAAPSVRLDWAAAPRARVRLEPRAGVRSSLRLRQLELTGALDPEGAQVALWTRGRLDRGSIAFAGRVRSREDARRVRLRLAAASLDLARVLRLAEDAPVGDLRGDIDLRAKYDEAGDAKRAERRVTGSASGRDVALRAHGVPGVWLRRVALSRFDVDLGRRSVALGQLRLRGPEAWVLRTGSGLVIPGLAAGLASGPEGPAWTVTLESADLADGTVHHLGAESGEQSFDVTLERAHAGPVGAPEAAVPFSLATVLATGGRVAGTGEAVRAPPSTRLHAELAAVALPPLATLARSPLRLESGNASGTLDATFEAGGVEASGTLVVSDVKTISPDPARPEDVLAFKEARLALRQARSAPPSAAFEKVEVDWPYVLVDRSAGAIFPFSLAAPAAPASKEGAPLLTVRIDALRVLGARIDFRDATLTPPYWRALANLGLEARAVEAPAVRVAELRASGLVDELSPLSVEGTIGARTHLVAQVERLALPPFNAYLEGASPYTVSSGAVSGKSEITLERSELEVNNQVILSRLGLSGDPGGDFVKRQLGIPLTLALALMKDYRGDIALALPFGGNLSEPSFSMRTVLFQSIVQAVRGAVLSPLNALGRVFLREGRIERIDLDAIPFLPGAREPDGAGHARVAQVAHVLSSHPDLAIRLRGLVGRGDADHLRDEAVLATLPDGRAGDPLRAFLRARLAGSATPTLDDAQRARLEALLAAVPWPGTALHDLAVDRGALVAAALILEHRLDAGRVSVDTPPTPAPEELIAAPSVAVEVYERR